MQKKYKRPTDPMQLAKLIGDLSTGQKEEFKIKREKSPAQILKALKTKAPKRAAPSKKKSVAKKKKQD